MASEEVAERQLVDELFGDDSEKADIDSLLKSDEPQDDPDESAEKPDSDDDDAILTYDNVPALSEDGDSVDLDDDSPGGTAPLAVVKGLRKDRSELREQLRQAELKAARLEGMQAAQTPGQPEPEEEEKGPIEQALDEDPNTLIDADMYAKQRAWELQQSKRQQEAEQSTSKAKAATQAQVLAKYTDAVLGEGLGIETLAGMGRMLLTSGDLAGIAAAGDEDAQMQQLHDMLILRIQRAGGDNAKAVRAAIKAKNTTRPELKPKPKGRPQADPEDSGEADYDKQSDVDMLTTFMFG